MSELKCCGYYNRDSGVLYLGMTAAVTEKTEALTGTDSNRTLNESYNSSDYSVEEEPLQSQEESVVATAKPGDLRKAEQGLRQPLVCKFTSKSCSNGSSSFRILPGHLGTTLPYQFATYQMAIERYKCSC